MKFPKNIGACIDMLYTLRDQRLQVQKDADNIKAQESELEEHILNSFNKTDLEGAKGKVATASVKRSTVPQVEDWDAFYQYIAKNKAWDLLQRRVGATAYNERLEQHVDVPGVKPFVKVTLSLTKASR